MYKLEFYKQAARYYKKLDAKTQKRINIAVDEMIKNPFEGLHIKKLKGRLEGKYRYNIGSLRIIYYVDVADKTIYVDAIGPRGDVYK
ncbi:MAG: type II toxin-antitoxin system RelE/ParE family toxin [Nitrospirae bacterium]|nr:type II toxin-antitoxin system RelE/ParE family toxin [Nitrospirota bacterium]